MVSKAAELLAKAQAKSTTVVATPEVNQEVSEVIQPVETINAEKAEEVIIDQSLIVTEKPAEEVTTNVPAGAPNELAMAIAAKMGNVGVSNSTQLEVAIPASTIAATKNIAGTDVQVQKLQMELAAEKLKVKQAQEQMAKLEGLIKSSDLIVLRGRLQTFTVKVEGDSYTFKDFIFKTSSRMLADAIMATYDGIQEIKL